MSWPWLMVAGLAVAVFVAAEWPRLERVIGMEARRKRQREKRKAKLQVITTEDDEFVRSVQRDLEALPTITEDSPKRR